MSAGWSFVNEELKNCLVLWTLIRTPHFCEHVYFFEKVGDGLEREYFDPWQGTGSLVATEEQAHCRFSRAFYRILAESCRLLESKGHILMMTAARLL